MLKKLLKQPLILFASYFGQHRRTNRTPMLWILMYHRILPHQDARFANEEPGMLISPDTLDMHLQEIKKYFQVMHLSQWIKDKEAGKPLPTKACAITFDDGWLDNYQFAWPILQKHNIPASIFIVADMAGTNQVFWPNLIAQVLKQKEQANVQQDLQWIPGCNAILSKQNLAFEERLSQLVNQAKQLNEEEIYPKLERLECLQSQEPALMSWEQIKELDKSPLIEFGSHTSRHLRLNDKLDKQTIKHEIKHSKTTIEQHLGHSIDLFCYPNGDYSDYSTQLVHDNYLAAVTTERGINNRHTLNRKLVRIGVHEDISNNKHSFRARLSGLV